MCFYVNITKNDTIYEKSRKMTNNIKTLLENKKSKITLKNFLLNENIKIRRTKPLAGGYWILITSDLSGQLGSKETAMMGAILKLRKTDVWPHEFEKPKHFSDKSTGIFGWGYFIGPNVTEEKSQISLNNLKTLISNYNAEKKLQPDTEVAGVTLGQLEQIGQIVQAIEQVAQETENIEAKSNLDKYLDDLQNAVENDDVFEFLIDNFEKAKVFQKRNSGWKYSILNALLITISDPTANYAGPPRYWEGRNYRIKNDFLKKGVFILKPKTGTGRSDVAEKAKFVKNNPEALEAFKRETGMSDAESLSDKNSYQLAKFATEKKLTGNRFSSRFEKTMVFTDNMVEPIPGMEPQELGTLNFADDINAISEENITPLFNAVLDAASKDSVVIPTALTSDKNNINNLSKILHAIAIKNLAGKFTKDPKNQNATEMEFLKVQAESVAHIIKKHYNLKSESSKYNIASWGGDKEKIKSVGDKIIRIADSIINKIDDYLKNNPNNAININESLIKLRLEIREILKNSNII